MEFKDILKELRLSHNLTQEELGKLVGLQKSAIYKYETGLLSDPKRSLIAKLAEVFDVSPAYLLGLLPFSDSEGVRIPILGRVVAGSPLEAVELVDGHTEIDTQLARKGEHFALRIKGASMEPSLREGDLIVVRRQETVNDGEAAIVLINGNDATVKRVKYQENGLTLIGDNPLVYPPHFYTSEEVESLPVRIIGKVVQSRRDWE